MRTNRMIRDDPLAVRAVGREGTAVIIFRRSVGKGVDDNAGGGSLGGRATHGEVAMDLESFIVIQKRGEEEERVPPWNIRGNSVYKPR